MTIPPTFTIATTFPHGTAGPGLELTAFTTLPGPLLPDTQWDFKFFITGDEGEFFSCTVFWPYPSLTFNPCVFTGSPTMWGNHFPDPGEGITIMASVSSSLGIYDQGSVPAIWDPTSGLAAVIEANTFIQMGVLNSTHEKTNEIYEQEGVFFFETWPPVQEMIANAFALTGNVWDGVTSTISTAAGAVTKTLGEIFSGKTLDQIGETELTSGPTCDDVNIVIGPGLFVYGITVRCTSVADWYAFTAPGGGWTPRDLCVLEVYRDEELLWRQGIHTRTYMLYPMPGVPIIPLRIEVGFVPPEYRIIVHWGEEVCGTVSMQRLP